MAVLRGYETYEKTALPLSSLSDDECKTMLLKRKDGQDRTRTREIDEIERETKTAKDKNAVSCFTVLDAGCLLSLGDLFTRALPAVPSAAVPCCAVPPRLGRFHPVELTAFITVLHCITRRIPAPPAEQDSPSRKNPCGGRGDWQTDLLSVRTVLHSTAHRPTSRGEDPECRAKQVCLSLSLPLPLPLSPSLVQIGNLSALILLV